MGGSGCVLNRHHQIMGQGDRSEETGLTVWEEGSTERGVLQSTGKFKHSSVGATEAHLKSFLFFHRFSGSVYNGSAEKAFLGNLVWILSMVFRCSKFLISKEFCFRTFKCYPVG